MTSILRNYSVIPGPATKFFDLLTAGYSDNYIINGDVFEMPIPYTVVNQVLEINVNQSPDVEAFVSNGSTPTNIIDIQAKLMGGTTLIKSFGPHMTTWLRNLIQNEESLGSQYSGPIVLYNRPTMTKIQLAAPAQGVSPLNSEDVYGITTEAPTSTEFIGGGFNQNFFTTWVFRSPLTIQYEGANGAYKYLTMTSQFTAN